MPANPKAKAPKSGLKTADGRVSIDAARLVFDFDRDTVSVIWSVGVTGIPGFMPPVESIFKVTELQKAQAQNVKQMMKWFIDEAVKRGDIPGGTVSA